MRNINKEFKQYKQVEVINTATQEIIDTIVEKKSTKSIEVDIIFLDNDNTGK